MRSASTTSWAVRIGEQVADPPRFEVAPDGWLGPQPGSDRPGGGRQGEATGSKPGTTRRSDTTRSPTPGGSADDAGGHTFTWNIVAIDGATAVVHGRTTYSDGDAYDNLQVIELADDGRARSFPERYTHRPSTPSSAHAPPPLTTDTAAERRAEVRGASIGPRRMARSARIEGQRELDFGANGASGRGAEGRLTRQHRVVVDLLVSGDAGAGTDHRARTDLRVAADASALADHRGRTDVHGGTDLGVRADHGLTVDPAAGGDVRRPADARPRLHIDGGCEEGGGVDGGVRGDEATTVRVTAVPGDGAELVLDLFCDPWSPTLHDRDNVRGAPFHSLHAPPSHRRISQESPSGAARQNGRVLFRRRGADPAFPRGDALDEAADRGLWVEPDADLLSQMQQVYLDLEGDLEDR